MARWLALRSVVPIAMTWGAFWAIAGTLRVFFWILRGALGEAGANLVTIQFVAINAIAYGIVGTLVGVVFTAVFARATRRGSGSSLSPVRGALLGAITGAIFAPLLLFLFAAVGATLHIAGTLSVVLLNVGLGAASGAATLGIARRGKLPPGDELQELNP